MIRILHVVLVGSSLAVFCARYPSVTSFIQQTNDVEKAGIIAMSFSVIQPAYQAVLLPLARAGRAAAASMFDRARPRKSPPEDSDR